MDAVVGILYSQTDDVQELTLVEGAVVLRGLASAVGNGETLACQIQPGVAIDQFIVLISCLAGGDASEQRGCGGYGFAARVGAFEKRFDGGLCAFFSAYQPYVFGMERRARHPAGPGRGGRGDGKNPPGCG